MLPRKPTRLDARLPWLAGVRAVLAPMSGITDRAFRDLCRPYGMDLGFCEFVAAPGLLHGEASWRLVDTEGEAGPVGVQLFGADPGDMAAAAERLRGRRLDVLDLNFGCPARKIVRKNGGSALLADLPLLERIVRAAIGAAAVPVTAKIRSGWDGASLNYREVGLLLQEAGCAWVTLHARTRAQLYAGRADLDHVAELVAALEIPVFGNGDVVDGAGYERMVRRTGCHAVMVGRGAIGDPWVFARCAAGEAGGLAEPPTFRERCLVMAGLVRAEIARHGESAGVRIVRKHLWRCFRGRPGSAALRRLLLAQPDGARTLALLNRLSELDERGGLPADLQDAARAASAAAPPRRSEERDRWSSC